MWHSQGVHHAATKGYMGAAWQPFHTAVLLVLKKETGWRQGWPSSRDLQSNLDEVDVPMALPSRRKKQVGLEVPNRTLCSLFSSPEAMKLPGAAVLHCRYLYNFTKHFLQASLISPQFDASGPLITQAFPLLRCTGESEVRGGMHTRSQRQRSAGWQERGAGVQGKQQHVTRLPSNS